MMANIKFLIIAFKAALAFSFAGNGREMTKNRPSMNLSLPVSVHLFDAPVLRGHDGVPHLHLFVVHLRDQPRDFNFLTVFEIVQPHQDAIRIAVFLTRLCTPRPCACRSAIARTPRTRSSPIDTFVSRNPLAASAGGFPLCTALVALPSSPRARARRARFAIEQRRASGQGLRRRKRSCARVRRRASFSVCLRECGCVTGRA